MDINLEKIQNQTLSTSITKSVMSPPSIKYLTPTCVSKKWIYDINLSKNVKNPSLIEQKKKIKKYDKCHS